MVGRRPILWANIKPALRSEHERMTTIGLLLAQRRRRWANCKPTFDQRLMVLRFMFAG